MKIVLLGPDTLTTHDETEIRKYLDAVIQEHEISLLAYRSIEKKVLKYFLDHEEYIPKLTLYTFPEIRHMSSSMQQTIPFLTERGATYKSFYYNEPTVTRSPYVEAWQYIMDDNDALVAFYNEEFHQSQRKKLTIPIDIAHSMKKKAFFHTLPVHNESLLQRKPSEKMRIIR